MIRWNNVSYAKNSRFLLQDISVELPAGQLTVILGPNGAGKSTFLRLCSKEMQPTTGTIELHQKDLQDWSCHDLALFRGVLSQSHPIAFPMEVSELVAMGRYPHKKRSSLNDKDRQIVQEALAECSVKHLEARSTQFLSGGELQRAQTARVLTQIWEDHQHHPRVLLLDEPTASLDPAYQHLCLAKAKKLTRQGVCVIAILHDLNLAARYADHIVFLKEGRLAAAGPMGDMMRESILQEVFSVDIHTVHDPRFAHPLIVTLGTSYQTSVIEPKLRSL